MARDQSHPGILAAAVDRSRPVPDWHGYALCHRCRPGPCRAAAARRLASRPERQHLHMVAFSALVACGLQFVPAGRSIVLGYTTPLWVMAGARIFLGERLTRSRVLGICIGLLGLMLLFDPSHFDWGDQAALLGNALVMLGAFCWAVSILHIRAHKWIATPFELVPWQALIATAILIPLACVFE